jgi:hypothetical protein
MTYTDADEVFHTWQTTPIDAQIYHEGTQLIESSNTQNDKGFVFVNADLSTISIPYRVKSFLYLPLAKTDATDFEDQYNDLTQTGSIPYMTVTQYLGGPELLPFAVIEKINLLYSLNQNLVDGEPLAKLANSEFTPTERTVLPGGAFWTVQLQPNESYPSTVYQTGDNSGNTYLNDKLYKTYKNQTADFAIAGIITGGINLIRIAIVNNGGDVFVMKVGLTSGGNEIGQISFPDDDTDSIDVGKLFTAPTTLYISGIAGTNLDITLDYNNYNAVPIAPPTQNPLWNKCTLYYFVEVPGGPAFTDEFTVATGLGNVGTDHEGCVLAGTNGTPSMTGLYPRGWNNAEIFPVATRQTIIGGDDVTIVKDNLPAIGLNVFNSSGSGSNPDLAPGNGYPAQSFNPGSVDRSYAIKANGTIPDRGPTENMGIADPVDITPHSLILPAFYYVGV